MAIPKIDQTDFLLNTINEMIRDLELRRAEILATRPPRIQPALISSFKDADGKVFHIKGRKKA
ncbi:MAG: hypothetical protein HOI42_13865 [Candidatus Marinimicrobia bacterium]|nr:hypothetical protein [Candidatus Neomarinimicrobiota bacterium]